MDKKVFLTSTDTTIGFISKDKKSLDFAKSRTPNKKYIKAIPDLKSIEKRVPKRFKKMVRRAKRSTFILDSNYSFRVIRDKKHKLLLDRLKWAYTTSANRSGEDFNLNYALKNCDIVVYPLKGGNASKIYRINKRRVKRIR
jgi:tRNA A37 threonylcarbamoyladenosine synthetase subunit TsaC/SUA5/YrdC